MTTPSQVVNLIQLLAGLSFLLLIFSGPWRQFVLDAVRQFLFQLRDRAFLLAADGKITFDDPTYLEFRDSINKVIGHLHEYSIFDLLFVKSVDSPHELLLTRIESIPSGEVRDVLMKSFVEMVAVVLVCMVLRSLLFTLLLFPVAVCAAVWAIINGPNNLWRISLRAHGAVTQLGADTRY
jgi:hypothetical protein